MEIKLSPKKIKKRVEFDTVRINLELFPPTADKNPEFDFRELYKKQTGRAIVVDEEQQPDFLKQLARKFEEKYNVHKKNGKCKRIRHLEDYVDLGMGYDKSDSFIDDSEAYDELVPSTMDTKHRGFYVNFGKMEYKEVERESDETRSLQDCDYLGASSSFSEENRIRKRKSKEVNGTTFPELARASAEIRKQNNSRSRKTASGQLIKNSKQLLARKKNARFDVSIVSNEGTYKVGSKKSDENNQLPKTANVVVTNAVKMKETLDMRTNASIHHSGSHATDDGKDHRINSTVKKSPIDFSTLSGSRTVISNDATNHSKEIIRTSCETNKDYNRTDRTLLKLSDSLLNTNDDQQVSTIKGLGSKLYVRPEKCPVKKANNGKEINRSPSSSATVVNSSEIVDKSRPITTLIKMPNLDDLLPMLKKAISRRMPELELIYKRETESTYEKKAQMIPSFDDPTHIRPGPKPKTPYTPRRRFDWNEETTNIFSAIVRCTYSQYERYIEETKPQSKQPIQSFEQFFKEGNAQLVIQCFPSMWMSQKKLLSKLIEVRSTKDTIDYSSKSFLPQSKQKDDRLNEIVDSISTAPKSNVSCSRQVFSSATSEPGIVNSKSISKKTMASDRSVTSLVANLNSNLVKNGSSSSLMSYSSSSSVVPSPSVNIKSNNARKDFKRQSFSQNVVGKVSTDPRRIITSNFLQTTTSNNSSPLSSSSSFSSVVHHSSTTTPQANGFSKQLRHVYRNADYLNRYENQQRQSNGVHVTEPIRFLNNQQQQQQQRQRNSNKLLDHSVSHRIIPPPVDVTHRYPLVAPPASVMTSSSLRQQQPFNFSMTKEQQESIALVLSMISAAKPPESEELVKKCDKFLNIKAPSSR